MSDDNKPYEPSLKKLEDARKKGEIPRSVDLLTAAAYAGFTLAIFVVFARSSEIFVHDLAMYFAYADLMSNGVFSHSGTPLAGSLIQSVMRFFAPIALIPALFVIAVLFVQQAWIFAPSKLEPKLSKISIISNFSQKFGRNGLFEFSKSFFKLCIFSIVLGLHIYNQSDVFLGAAHLEARQNIALMLTLAKDSFPIIVIISVTIGIADYLWQRAEHTRKNMMSYKEMTDEIKDSEGDPHIKQKRRQRASDIATNKMLQDVPLADVVIVNPTHYAVALKWDRATGRAPTCVAKGVDEIAAKIRSIAAENGVPVRSDPPTARAIFATIDIGQDINPDHYKAIAAAIRFAEKMRKKARR